MLCTHARGRVSARVGARAGRRTGESARGRVSGQVSARHGNNGRMKLASGRTLELEIRGETLQLSIDGTPQSAVNADPTRLSFGYIRHMGHVLDLAFPARQPITALHLGAGALTLPRYLHATRPGSRQQVIELERDLVDAVREVAPLPESASIRIRYGDAREQLARLPAGLHGHVDAVIVDIFAGPSTPAHVTTVEFFSLLQPLLAPGAVVLVNVADGHELRFARGEIASILTALGPTTLVADPAVVKGRRFGNITAVAAREERDFPGLARLAATGFPPATVLTPAQTCQWLRGTTPVHDEDAVDSPVPGRGTFSIVRR